MCFSLKLRPNDSEEREVEKERTDTDSRSTDHVLIFRQQIVLESSEWYILKVDILRVVEL